MLQGPLFHHFNSPLGANNIVRIDTVVYVAIPACCVAVPTVYATGYTNKDVAQAPGHNRIHPIQIVAHA